MQDRNDRFLDFLPTPDGRSDPASSADWASRPAPAAGLNTRAIAAHRKRHQPPPRSKNDGPNYLDRYSRGWRRVSCRVKGVETSYQSKQIKEFPSSSKATDLDYQMLSDTASPGFSSSSNMRVVDGGYALANSMAPSTSSTQDLASKTNSMANLSPGVRWASSGDKNVSFPLNSTANMTSSPTLPIGVTSGLRRVKSSVASPHHPVEASNLRRINSSAIVLAPSRDNNAKEPRKSRPYVPAHRPLPLAKVRSFDPAKALLNSPFACGSQEFLQLPQLSVSDERTVDVANEHVASISSMGGSFVNYQSSDGAKEAHAVSTISATSPLPADCDYDTNPTELYLAVQNKRWDLVVQRLSKHKSEASTWVSRKESDGKTLRWRLLPIHAAIIFQAPAKVIGALLDANRHGAQCRDDQGKLPIHLSFRRDTNKEVIAMLLEAFPQSMTAKDDKGRTPLMLAMQSRSPQRHAWIQLLDNFPTTKPGQENMPLVEMSTECADSSMKPCVARAPQVPKAAMAARRSDDHASTTVAIQTQARMDSELMEKLNRRREKVDSVHNGIRPSNRSEEDAISEEGMEVEYTDGVDGATILEGPTSLKRDCQSSVYATPVGRDNSHVETMKSTRGDCQLSIKCDNVFQTGSEITQNDQDGGCNTSIVDMAPPSLKGQMRDRLQRKNETGTSSGKITSASHPDDSRDAHLLSSSGKTTSTSHPNDSIDVHLTINSRKAGENSSLCSSKHKECGISANKVGEIDMKSESYDDNITVASSICDSTTSGESVDGGNCSIKSGSLGRYFTMKKVENKTSPLAKKNDEMTTKLTERHQQALDNCQSSVGRGRPPAISPSLDVTPKKNNVKHSLAKKDQSAIWPNHRFDREKEKGSVIAATSHEGAAYFSHKQVQGYCRKKQSFIGDQDKSATTSRDSLCEIPYRDPMMVASTPGSDRFLLKHERVNGKQVFRDTMEKTGYQTEHRNCIQNRDTAAPTLEKGAERFSSGVEKHQEGRKTKNIYSWKCGDEPEIYASTSLLTASTAELTEIPSNSHEDCSLSEVYTSFAYRTKSDEASVDNAPQEPPTDDGKNDPLDEELSTPKLLMRLEKLRNKSFFVSPVKSESGAYGRKESERDDDLATPNLMKKAERFFSSTEGLDMKEERASPLSPVSRADIAVQSACSSCSIAQSKFDRIMAKYEGIDSSDLSVEKEAAPRKEGRRNVPIGTDFSKVDPHAPSTTEQGSQAGIDDVNIQKDTRRHVWDIKFRARLPKRPHPDCRKEPNPSPLSGPKLEPSVSEETGEGFFMNITRVGSEESDAVSTLSRSTGYTTIGSVSIATTNSTEIESYVQSVVHDIVAQEVTSAGSLKKELESALKNKIKLERRVKKLMDKSTQQSLQLKKAHNARKIAKDKFSREMEIQLTRKASELKSCVELALIQAEQAKQRALELAQQDKEREISMLRSQLDLARANGVPIDRSLQKALELVESNQRALRQAAQNDAKSAHDMKKNLEASFESAVGEFESWSDRQLRIMETRWERLRYSEK